MQEFQYQIIKAEELLKRHVSLNTLARIYLFVKKIKGS